MRPHRAAMLAALAFALLTAHVEDSRQHSYNLEQINMEETGHGETGTEHEGNYDIDKDWQDRRRGRQKRPDA